MPRIEEAIQHTVPDMITGTSCQSDPAIFLTGIVGGLLIGAFLILLYVKVKYK